MSVFNALTSIVDKPKKRIGRGYGSGRGSHTSGRGTKGYKSRVGSKVPLWFEGGQLPLIKRLPMMRGKSKFKVLKPSAEVSLAVLQKMTASTITLETLKLEGIIDKRFTKAKVIATGELNRAVTLTGIGTSAKARELITKAGGTIN